VVQGTRSQIVLVRHTLRVQTCGQASQPWLQEPQLVVLPQQLDVVPQQSFPQQSFPQQLLPRRNRPSSLPLNRPQCLDSQQLVAQGSQQFVVGPQLVSQLVVQPVEQPLEQPLEQPVEQPLEQADRWKMPRNWPEL
jgi:hypothetical protein